MAAKTTTGAKPVTGAGDSVIHTYTLTSADPNGDAITGYEDYADISVVFRGTWGTATAQMQGSHDGTNWFGLTDLQGTAISKTADSLEGVAEAAPYLRPALSTPGAGATITATVYMRKTK